MWENRGICPAVILEASMSNELVSILVGLPTVGIALIAVILASMYRMETRLREDMGQLREDMKQVEGRLREEMKQSEGRLREDMGQLRGDLKQLGDRVARLEHGQAKLEGLLEGLREAISGRAVSG